MANRGRSLAPKEPEWDARSMDSFNSAEHERGFQSHQRHYSPYGTEDERPETAKSEPASFRDVTHPVYPPSYARVDDDRSQQERPMAPTAYMHEDPDRAYMNNVPVERAPRISTWKRPWFCYVISVVQLAVFIGQCIHGWKLTGSPIEIHPSFNPMIGPSVYNSINMGARFIPCMKNIANITDVVTAWPCPNATTTAGLTACSLAELCGNGASEGVQEKQWWRFIVPIFLHAGIVHILFNLLVQVRLGGQVEMDIGPILFIPIYLAAGIGGYLFGGNFAGDGVTSTGASGSIFSIFSLSLLDLIYHWKQIQSPMRGLLVLLADVIISFVLGLLPGVDNFSHIGGFIIGILLGIALLKMPDALTRRVKEYQKVDIHMSHIGTEARPATSKSVGRPGMTLFKDRSPYWWAYWIVRAVCLTLTVVIFILLIKNFYNENASTCFWCKYLSCLPVSNWCSIGDLTTTTTTT